VADVQAADRPDGSNDGRIQRYALATAKLGVAIDAWLGALRRRRTRRSSSPPPLCCVLNLGDIVDGRDDEATTSADLGRVLAQFERLPASCPAVHVIGNHCLKLYPRDKLVRQLRLPSCYYRRELAPGWALLVLDTTDLSAHGGWVEGSAKADEAAAYLAAHAGEPQMMRYNGGVGAEQRRWLDAQLARARRERVQLLVASHHCLARGACRATHRSWNGDEISEAFQASGVVRLCLAEHDHQGVRACVTVAPEAAVCSQPRSTAAMRR